LSFHKKSFSIYLLTLVLLLFLSGYSVSAQLSPTESRLQSANERYDQAFGFVLAAEKVGANVTSLVGQLNSAADLLSQAKNSYRAGNSAGAEEKADDVLSITLEVSSSAKALKVEAQNAVLNNLAITLSATIAGSAVFLVVLFLVWIYLKNRYIKSIGELKPEVVSDET
jgi:hypothetical protein